ncbi:hypothetical protein GWI33_023144, partial [Rhynchophorus ferrugineus]
FDKKKGFYCQVVKGDSTKCLGRSKGRQYPPMEEKSLKYLQRLFLTIFIRGWFRFDVTSQEFTQHHNDVLVDTVDVLIS